MGISEEEYFKNRVDNQISWYSAKSSTQKTYFMMAKITEIILALCVPFLSGYITDGSKENVTIKITIGILGVIVAAIAGIITLTKLQENWIQYRTVCEILKHEKFLYLTKAGIYDNNPKAFQNFAERFEAHIAKENSDWAAYVFDEK